jgi:putative ABC transport system permease protein
MSASSIVAVALKALRRNLFRTVLTMVGIAVGVAAVITIVALGSGAQTAIEDDVMAAGTNLIIVSAGNFTSGGVRLGMGSSSRLTADDASSISTLPGVAYVAPGVRVRKQLVAGGENWAGTIDGTGADLPRIRSWALQYGHFFGPEEVRDASKVCVIGTIVRDMLFGTDANPVGQLIRIGTEPFIVTGLLASKGQSSTGEDQDDVVFVPYTTAQKRLMGVTYLRNVLVSTTSADQIGSVAAHIRELLRARHEILPDDPDDFRVRTLEEITALRTRSTRTMTVLLGGVAAVSLLVGGIGVMNIMLVSVTERTREIGVRVAVGARSRDVRRQFLTEAVFVSAAGGIVGIALGYIISTSLTQFLEWPTDISSSTALGSFAFAAFIGIFFGWYPARRAAEIDPIDALRFE